MDSATISANKYISIFNIIYIYSTVFLFIVKFFSTFEAILVFIKIK